MRESERCDGAGGLSTTAPGLTSEIDPRSLTDSASGRLPPLAGASSLVALSGAFRKLEEKGRSVQRAAGSEGK